MPRSTIAIVDANGILDREIQIAEGSLPSWLNEAAMATYMRVNDLNDPESPAGAALAAALAEGSGLLVDENGKISEATLPSWLTSAALATKAPLVDGVVPEENLPSWLTAATLATKASLENGLVPEASLPAWLAAAAIAAKAPLVSGKVPEANLPSWLASAALATKAPLDVNGKVPETNLPSWLAATALAAKAPLVGGKVPETNLPSWLAATALAAKAPIDGNGRVPEANLPSWLSATALAAKAPLVSGLVPEANLPSWLSEAETATHALKTDVTALATDVAKGVAAKSAVDLITTNTWQPNTVYALGRFLLDPNGITVKVTTAHTSTSSYDASKFTTTVSVLGDATVAGYVNTLGSATNMALNSVIAGFTRTNFCTTPSFDYSTTSRINLCTTPNFEYGSLGTWTDGSNSTFAISTAQKHLGTSSAAVTRSNTTTGGCYARHQFQAVSGLDYSMTLWFYGGAGAANTYTFKATGSVTTSILTFTPGASWQKLTLTGTASSSGTVSLYVTDDLNNAPVAGTVFYIDEVLIEQATTPGAYFDGDTTNTSSISYLWDGAAGNAQAQAYPVPPKLGFQSGTGGVAALNWQAGPGADGLPGFARLTWTTASSSAGGINAGSATTGTIPIPVSSYTVGDTYTFSAYVRSSKAQTITWGTYFRLGTSGSLPGSGQTNFNLAANTWTRVSRTINVPVTADNAYFYLYAATGFGWAVGDTLDIDNILVEKTPTLDTYFDGGTPGTGTTANAWSGAPQASASTQRVVPSAVKPLMTRTGAQPVGQGEFWVNMADYLVPNRVIGTTDDLPAFTAALGKGTFGAVKVYAPAGEYWISSAILMPSFSELGGAGIDATVIRLLPTASNDTWVVTNSTPTAGGNTNISVHDMTLDWRWSVTRKGGGGGTRSSCLTLRAVQYAWIDRVKSINSGLHAFDVAQGSIDYPYNGDGSAEPTDPSRYVWIRNCIGTAWGDDGITTHHSEYIWLENNYMYDPRERGNCNGIEIDDGSRRVFLANNMTRGCYGGVELKAHETANAAKNIVINGHYDEGSCRSYNFRHIGHHSGTDTVSTSAFDIICTNLVSVNANSDKGFQDGDMTPRALCLSAYHRVSINGFTAIGRGGYAAGDMAIAIQYRSGHISLTGVNITGWTGADKDISVTSGDNISISGVNIQNSAKRAIYTGSTVSAVQIWGVNATAPASGSMYGIDLYDSTGVELSGIAVQGYPIPIRADFTDYATTGAFLRRASDVPAGVTSMKNLDPSKDYYASTTAFATFGIDRPAPAASAGGGYWITHSRLTADSTIQTLTRNTSGTSQAQYWRVLNYVAKTASAWNQNTITAVAYSAT